MAAALSLWDGRSGQHPAEPLPLCDPLPGVPGKTHKIDPHLSSTDRKEESLS